MEGRNEQAADGLARRPVSRRLGTPSILRLNSATARLDISLGVATPSASPGLVSGDQP